MIYIIYDSKYLAEKVKEHPNMSNLDILAGKFKYKCSNFT